MKKLGLLVLTIIFTVGCSSTKTMATKEGGNTNSISFEYEAMTRGAYKKVVVTQDSILTIKDHEMKDVVAKAISKADWDKLMSISDTVNLEGMEALKAPSNKSFADAAMAANLKVIKNDTTYKTGTFDHGNPPAEIRVLVFKIIAMSDLPKTK